MVAKDKKDSCYGDFLKNPIFRGRFTKKKIYRVGLP